MPPTAIATYVRTPRELGLVAAALLLASAACGGGLGPHDASTVDARDGAAGDAPSALDARADVPTASDVVATDAHPLDASRDDATAPTDAAGPTDARRDVGVDAPVVPVDAGPSSSRQVARPLGTTGAANGFYEYLPPGYASGAGTFPLLMFWHGVGEDGSGSAADLMRVLDHGPPLIIQHNTWPADRPFIVLSPQHGPSGCPSANEIHDFTTWALGHYRVDTRRVFLTALSCGAIGSWQYINAYGTAQVAAVVLMSGDPGDPTASSSAWGHSMCGLGAMAIWAFHGDMDPTVNIANERTTMTDLLACPAPPRRETQWTVIAGGGHVIWDPIYNLSSGYQIYDFLLRNPHP